jgi:hypothetical protein
MEKVKTVLGIILIGSLIYLYIEHFPDIARSIQRYLLTGFSTGQDVRPKEEKPKEGEKIKNTQQRQPFIEREKSVQNKAPDIFQPIDEYERKAEEEIDKLLELN